MDSLLNFNSKLLEISNQTLNSHNIVTMSYDSTKRGLTASVFDTSISCKDRNECTNHSRMQKNEMVNLNNNNGIINSFLRQFFCTEQNFYKSLASQNNICKKSDLLLTGYNLLKNHGNFNVYSLSNLGTLNVEHPYEEPSCDTFEYEHMDSGAIFNPQLSMKKFKRKMKEFRYNYKSNGKNNRQSSFLDMKNMHEKERNSIGRQIQNDCDTLDDSGFYFITDNDLSCLQRMKSTSKSEKCEDPNEPPARFQLNSLEDFPTIEASDVRLKQHPHHQSNGDHLGLLKNVLNETEFVMFSNDVTKVPSFVPRHQSLCERVSKIVKIPQNLICSTVLPKRSCLNQKKSRTNSNESDTSDDFIVFDHGLCDSSNNEDEDVDFDDDDDEDVDDDDDDDECSSDTDDTFNGTKKVRFNPKPPVIHTIRAWDFAYRQARRGDCWQQCALDRQRFKRRITDVEKILDPVLGSSHRKRIFSERFQ